MLDSTIPRPQPAAKAPKLAVQLIKTILDVSSSPSELWIDGNHENFDMLYQFPLIDKFGGKVREIAPDIYHLDRGQVLTIDGKKIFCMGGARSVDKEYRVEHISWWKEEMPSREEMERAIAALEQNHWRVDYVIHIVRQGVFRLCSQAGTRTTRWSAF